VLSLVGGFAQELGLIRDDWNGFNVLHTAAARVGGLEMGLVPGEGGRDVAGILEACGTGEIELVFLIGADEIDTSALGNAFVVYQGSHGDRGAAAADVVLPGAAYTEKNASWVNTEGRLQRGKLAAFPPGEAKEDWKILRALSEVLGRKVPLDTLGQVRARMAEIAPSLATPNQVTKAAWGAFGHSGDLDRAPFASPIADFYLTNPISRASTVMNECSALFVQNSADGATGTHG
jgi:NADH-quinone oxidoreductase subunit G